jgi:2-oxoglutarate dehydrogenase E2 component (dihydrolipoamide succinyltransferase)
MSVSVSMPQLGESVTEGTVTRWLKQEGDRVEADEPLLEVSTDKVDTEIPSPVSGILRGITVAEDETVAVGAELAIIDEEGSGGGAAQPAQQAEQPAAQEQPAPGGDGQPGAGPAGDGAQEYNASAYQQPYAEQPTQQAAGYEAPPAYTQPPPGAEAPQMPSFPPAQQTPTQQYPTMPGGEQQAPAAQAPPAPAPEAPAPQAPAPRAPEAQPQVPQQAAPQQPPAPPRPAPQAPPQPADAAPEEAPAEAPDGVGPDLGSGAEGPYVTPLVRKLAAEHGIDLGAVSGTGVGGRIRKQDVLDAARELRDSGAAAGQQAAPAQAPPQQAAPQQAAPQQAAPQQAAPQQAPPAAPPAQAPAAPQAPAASPGAAPAAPAAQARPEIVPSSLRGRTEKLSRSRQVIAQRMVESLQTSAQLTTVVEADVTAIARLRQRAKAGFEAREGVKLSFLPFFALATVEALKVHPSLNAIIDTASNQVTYHDAEHLGIAVDTERGLIVPVIHDAGDLNIGGLARKIADLAARTRAARISPDELSGGTFTLTNTGSRGALFDTPIINQPQVGILGTGAVVKRAVVVEDPHLGEVITVRSMVYLSLTYDHRLVDGADAARFLGTMKGRLEEGGFEAELGL